MGAANILIGIIAFLHLNFLVLEMFLWATPVGLKVFNQSIEAAKVSAVLAANQGLYNGFLTAGLVWGLLAPVPEQAKEIKIFFLTCVAIAGLYGAWTVSRNILIVQALPAIVALALLYFSN